jgi:hypothetical protein
MFAVKNSTKRSLAVSPNSAMSAGISSTMDSDPRRLGDVRIRLLAILLTSSVCVVLKRSLNDRFRDVKIRLTEFGNGGGEVEQVSFSGRFKDVERACYRESTGLGFAVA